MPEYPLGKHPNQVAALNKHRGLYGNKGNVVRKLKSDIFECYKELGGKDYLAVVATEDPKTFCNLLSKLIPIEMKAELGRPGEFDHLNDEELDNAIIAKFREQYRDRFPDLVIDVGGEGTEAGRSKLDPIHQEDQTGLSGSPAPSPDSAQTGTGGTG